MDNKKKKIGVIALVVVIIVGVVLATVTVNRLRENNVRSGTVQVANINLQLKDQAGNVVEEISDWEPGDVDQVTWTVENTGTAAVYTRNKIQIWWNEEIPDNQTPVLYLYPANMSKAEVIEDFKRGNEARYAIPVTRGDIAVDSTTNRKGIEYQVLGDVLDGTKMTGKSSEVDYNLTTSLKTTDDSSATKDVIAYNILFSPRTSYLYEGKTLTIKVITEAMQYTNAGKEEWHIVDSQTLGD